MSLSKSKTLQWTLTDDDGGVHKYMSIKLSVADSIPLLGDTMKLAPALGRVFDALKGAASADAASMMDFDLSRLSGVALGEALAVFGLFFKEAGPGYFRALFAGTVRDGKRLDDAGEFELAFHGNLGELMFASFDVAKHNFQAVLSRPLGRLFVIPAGGPPSSPGSTGATSAD